MKDQWSVVNVKYAINCYISLSWVYLDKNIEAEIALNKKEDEWDGSYETNGKDDEANRYHSNSFDDPTSNNINNDVDFEEENVSLNSNSILEYYLLIFFFSKLRTSIGFLKVSMVSYNECIYELKLYSFLWTLCFFNFS